MTPENQRVRAELMALIADYIKTEGITQTEAAERFGTYQPRVNDIVRGRVKLCSIDRMVDMLSTVNIRLQFQKMQ